MENMCKKIRYRKAGHFRNSKRGDRHPAVRNDDYLQSLHLYRMNLIKFVIDSTRDTIKNDTDVASLRDHFHMVFDRVRGEILDANEDNKKGPYAGDFSMKEIKKLFELEEAEIRTEKLLKDEAKNLVKKKGSDVGIDLSLKEVIDSYGIEFKRNI